MPDEKTFVVVLEESPPIVIGFETPPPVVVTVGEQGPPGPATVAIAFGEIPAGTIDGVNAVFTLSFAPNPVGAIMLFLNGLLQRNGAGNDFTISGVTITMGVAPLAGDSLIATYPY